LANFLLVTSCYQERSRATRKGAGKAIADRLLQGSATVVITARSAPEEKTESHFLQADVSTFEGTARVIREMLDRFRGVDIIVYNVGGS